jgi:SAM-dependent methyltransferase
MIPKAQFEILFAPNTIEVGQTVHFNVRVANIGELPWLARAANPVSLSYHWLASDRTYFVRDGLRTPLPADLQPGEQVVVPCEVMGPNTPGRFFVEFDMVQEQVGWFKAHGSPTALTVCEVVVPEKRVWSDRDYENAWKDADLNEDYWTLTGPASKDEFESLGRTKRQMLVDLGLTPASRVLDVGCGTGSLTQALFDYLGPQGLYYGTDIGAEAVAFCQKKYRRPNFHFLRNDATRIPIDGKQFDIIVLFSVFTHLYPQEIRAMLEDLRRLLDVNGLIIADVFVALDVDKFDGGHGPDALVAINETHLLETFAPTGLHFTVLDDSAWGTRTRRVLYKIGHAAADSRPT